jgi:protein-S-isoprenylcysteine O-methyltransferase Ste14
LNALRILPPPAWALIVLAALYYASALPGLRDLPLWQSKPLGDIVMAIGIAVPVIAILHFRLAGTQVMPTSKRNNRLVTTGFYALTRNPMYAGVTLFALGAAIWVGRPLMYFAPIIVFAIANWVFIPFEEEKMRRQYGAEFDEYARRVRRWI